MDSTQFIRLRNAHILIGSAIVVMAGSLVTPGLPLMLEAYSSEPNSELLVKLALTIPALFIALFSPVAGVVVDRFGFKHLLLFSLTLFALAGGASYFLDALSNHLIARSLLGIGYAGILTALTTYIAVIFQSEKLNRFMGLQAAFISFGAVVFLSLGGILAESGWRVPFLVYFLVLVLVPGTQWFLKNKPSEKIANTSTSATKTPFPKKTIFPIYLLCFFNMVIFLMILLEMPSHLKSIGTHQPSHIGAALSMMTLVSAIASLSYPKLKRHLSHFALFALLFLSMAAGYLIFAFSYSYGVVLLGLLFMGVGFGLIMPNTNTWLVAMVPQSLLGRVNGGLNTFVFLGQFSSPFFIYGMKQVFTLRECFGVASIVMVLIHVGFWIAHKQTRKIRWQNPSLEVSLNKG